MRSANTLFAVKSACKFDAEVVAYLKRVNYPSESSLNASKLSVTVDEDTVEVEEPYVSIVKVSEDENSMALLFVSM